MVDDGPLDGENGAAGARADADAFALVGNEHRAAILQALLDAHADPETPYPTPFAVLRERAGVDVSAQFAYHLDELLGAFVAKTGDGYRLRYAGWKAAAALAAGTYTSQPAFGPTHVDGTCPHCGANDVHASYGDAWLTVTCHGCGRVLTRYPFPPGPAADRLHDGGVDALLDAFDRRTRSHFSLATDGVCPECAGRTRTGLEPVANPGETSPTTTLGDGHAVQAVADCERCGNHLTLPVGLLALGDHDVVAVLADHDFDPETTPFWELPVLDDDAVARSDTDPLEATVAVRESDALDVDDAETAVDVAVTADLDVRAPANR